MRKHFYKFVTWLTLSVMTLAMSISSYASDLETVVEGNEAIVESVAAEPAVDTITLDDQELWNGNVPADIRWKTKQDKGQWIEEIGLAENANSLLLIVNNLDKEDPNALPGQSETELSQSQGSEAVSPSKDPALKKRFLSRINKEGQSQLLYLSKNTEGEWVEILSAACTISGGQMLKKEEIYGVYKPKKSFGLKENPGSLLSYQTLTGNEYWALDPKDERYGDLIISDEPRHKMEGTANLQGMKAFFDYGMIMETEGKENEEIRCSALILNCLQPESRMNLFAGIQLPEATLRMIQQCVDENTRMIIVGSVDELEQLGTGDEMTTEE